MLTNATRSRSSARRPDAVIGAVREAEDLGFDRAHERRQPRQLEAIELRVDAIVVGRRGCDVGVDERADRRQPRDDARLIAEQIGGRLAGADERAGLAAGQREVERRAWPFGCAVGAGAVELHREERLRVVRRQQGALPRQAIALQARVVGAGLPRIADAAVEKARALVQLERRHVDRFGRDDGLRGHAIDRLARPRQRACR